MSFVKSYPQQLNFFSKYNKLSPFLKKRLEDSWAHDFREVITLNINEDAFAPLYSSNHASRPNTPIRISVGLLILKSIKVQTDAEALDSLYFDDQYKYALDCLDYDMNEKPHGSENTLYNLRTRLYEHMLETGEDILHNEMERISKLIAVKMKLSGTKFRMDSIMIETNCRILKRRDLIRDILFRSVKSLIKYNKGLEGLNISDSLKKYQSSEEMYNDNKLTMDEENALFLSDIKDLLKFIIDNPQFKNLTDIALFQRFAEEQTEVKNNEIKLKEDKEISPRSILTPVDPDATVRKKAGKGHYGYVGNMLEMYDEKGEPGIITGMGFEQNVHSDSAFCKEELNKIKDECVKKDKEVILTTDGAYFSADNSIIAREHNIKMVPSHIKNIELSDKDKILLEFKIYNNDDKWFAICPQGYEANKVKFTSSSRDYYLVHLSKDLCNNCPRRNDCKKVITETGKNTYWGRISLAAIERARATELFEDEYYKKIADERAGVEGIPSILRRRYKIDKLPVRGKCRVKVWFCLSIMAINFKRYRKRVA